MANIKISELNPLVTIQDADVLPIVDNAVTQKVTAAILRSYTEGNSVLLTGAQTVAGIKTFTAQLASTVATGTAPFSVASTTKVTNLNADLLDGLSSADFALSTRTLTAGTGLTGGGDLTANRTFAIDSTVATLTGTQTLTNKTLTSPVINEILDSNGNEILGFTPIASATDYITIKNGIGVGVPLHISAAGSSANTGIHLEPKGTGLVQISDGTDTTKGIRFRSSSSAASAVTLIDAVSSAGRVITLPNATTTLVGTNTTDTLTNKSIAGDTNTLSNIGNASLTNSAITINGTSTSLGGSINVGTVTSVAALTLGTSGTDLSSTVATGTTTPVITLNVPTASASNRGALSSTDWSTFNGKQNAITLTTTGTSGAATLVGSTLNIPNYADTDTGITSLNGLTALTQTFAVGTSGTDFGISSATSTHTFNLPTASAANRGALSSADWTTFNNKTSNLGTVTSVGLTSATSGVTIGASPVTTSGDITLAIATATSGQNGLLSSTDWTTFNNKQNALTNPITGTGTTNYLPKFTGASALGNSNIQDSGSLVSIGVSTLINTGTVNQNTTISGNKVSMSRTSDAAEVVYFSKNTDLGAEGTANINGYNGIQFRTQGAETVKLTIAENGAATFASSVTAGGDLTISRSSNSTLISTIKNTDTTNTSSRQIFDIEAGTVGLRLQAIHNDNVYISPTTAVSTYLGFGNSLILGSGGAATFSSSVTAGADATINGVTVGKGAGNVASNTAVGFEAAFSNTTGVNNTAIGYQALRYNTTGGLNTALGYVTLLSNTTGEHNTGIGRSSLNSNTTGSYNTAVGLNSLDIQTTGNDNTGIGWNVQSGNYSGSVILGKNAASTANNQFVVGSAGTNAGAVTTEVNASTKVWNVIINGVAQKILLA